MSEDKNEHGAELGLDDLEDVAGGIQITRVLNGKTSTLNVTCPRCGSSDLSFQGDAVDSINNTEENLNFMFIKVLVCNNCHHTHKGGWFRIEES